ncbi:putative ATPase [Duganella sp. SG902]|uniref:AAA family ATPase n=1 Tax=Duganella sp. SG902 TaxID=2587016 RepID=UPI00159E8A9C|nr:AAA family ATPase [Duganella sp. SG902]NVM79523.1 putative ATPase [Duganella sp. SG902]
MTPTPFLTRIVLHNYKSIASCDVRLGPLTYLVGPNGAGKSNFLDALRLVADALRTSLSNAINSRWGVLHLLHRNVGQVSHLGIRLEFRLPGGSSGHYAFTLERSESAAYQVGGEECYVGQHWYQIAQGRLVGSSVTPFPAISQDRLALVSASGLPVFRPVFDALSAMSMYNLNPQAMRAQQPPQDGHVLKENGENIAGVLNYLRQSHYDALQLIEEYLAIIVPTVHGLEHFSSGPMETVVFKQSPGGQIENRFYANNMSDGTLRALGVLTALFQRNDVHTPRLVGLEEPETALHPAAFAAVREAMVRASEQRQIIVVSHSPDLLDDMDLEPENVLSVQSVGGETLITAVDGGSYQAIKTHLYSAGELLRMGQLGAGHASVRPAPAVLWGPSPP